MKKVLIGVTGSIAAYKIAELTRLLKKSQYEVRIVMTESATEIITPMTLQVLSHNTVRVDIFDHENEAEIDHISLSRWPDIIVIAPATANSMAKMAHGIADDLLSTLYLATNKPVAIAPAMNTLMWQHPATQSNLDILLARQTLLIAPDSGEQACGDTGTGRMSEPQHIHDWIENFFSQPLGYNHCTKKQLKNTLTGHTIVITAGPTIERIDPVRYISNDSSGKMGYSLAQQASRMGAHVILISGKTQLPKPEGVVFISVTSAQEMHTAVMEHVASATVFIATAAVADYRVAHPAEHKMKKTSDAGMTLELVQNPDILRSVCQLNNKPFCVGFAAETEHLIEHAQAKRIHKGADIIIANDVSDTSIGFNSNNNAVTVISDNGHQDFASMPKEQLAAQLMLLINSHLDTGISQ